MSGPIHKERLHVWSSSQFVQGRPISAGLDPIGDPSIWYVAFGQAEIVTVPTGSVPPFGGRHISTFNWGELVLHVWVIS